MTNNQTFSQFVTEWLVRNPDWMNALTIAFCVILATIAALVSEEDIAK